MIINIFAGIGVVFILLLLLGWILSLEKPGEHE